MTLSSSSLLCSETPDDVISSDWAPHPSPTRRPISLLLAAELQPSPLPLAVSANVRQNYVDWILNVNEFYRFSPLTAYLAVSYLDRFLSFNSPPNGESGGGWAMQLLSVACVSVSAKMEETHVPLLLDLQILDPPFLFEPKTVARMELLLMSALRWRMRTVTPFDFFDHFADLFGSHFYACSRPALLSRAADLIVASSRVSVFFTYRPSEAAASAILCAFKEIGQLSASQLDDLLRAFNDWVSKENMSACIQLMEASPSDTIWKSRVPKPVRELPASPQSPVGFVDAAVCRSCESSRELLQPPAKRLRLDKRVYGSGRD